MCDHDGKTKEIVSFIRSTIGALDPDRQFNDRQHNHHDDDDEGEQYWF